MLEQYSLGDLEEVGVPGGDVVRPLLLVLVVLGERGVVLDSGLLKVG